MCSPGAAKVLTFSPLGYIASGGERTTLLPETGQAPRTGRQPGLRPPPPLPQETKKPTPEIDTRAETARVRGQEEEIRKEARKRAGLVGRRSTILTGGAGLTEPATIQRRTLLGA